MGKKWKRILRNRRWEKRQAASQPAEAPAAVEPVVVETPEEPAPVVEEAPVVEKVVAPRAPRKRRSKSKKSTKE